MRTTRQTHKARAKTQETRSVRREERVCDRCKRPWTFRYSERTGRSTKVVAKLCTQHDAEFRKECAAQVAQVARVAEVRSAQHKSPARAGHNEGGTK